MYTHNAPIVATLPLMLVASHQSPSPLLTIHYSLLTAYRELQISLLLKLFTFLYTQNIFVLA